MSKMIIKPSEIKKRDINILKSLSGGFKMSTKVIKDKTKYNRKNNKNIYDY